MLVHALMEEQCVDTALGMLLNFELSLRPGELFGIRAIDFVVGGVPRSKGSRSKEEEEKEGSYVDVVLNPHEVGVG